MAVFTRFNCAKCCLEVAMAQAVPQGVERCARCQLAPLLLSVIPVDNTGRAPVRYALYTRAKKGMALSTAKSIVKNICLEQFNTWRRNSWAFVNRTQRRKRDKVVYLLTHWRDVREFCSFEDVAAGTNILSCRCTSLHNEIDGVMHRGCPSLKGRGCHLNDSYWLGSLT